MPLKTPSSIDPSVEALFVYGGDENKALESRFKDAKRTNGNYEQMMDMFYNAIEDGQKNNQDVTFFQTWLRRVVSAERVRPDKSFYYHWVTTSVEDIIEENPDIKFNAIKKKIDWLQTDATDKQIRTGLKVLQKDQVIKKSNGGFTKCL
ncbi:MAG: hypothetical protein KJI69_03460 [Patescibacteria group bacterium]|nr:hypothetical protein [Patescibacteria group bacterium]